MSLESQSLRMDSIPNARDLKGYVMQDGRRVKAGRLLRSGDLSQASDRDIRRLHEEFHLAVDFDFRMEMEVSQSPDRPVEGNSEQEHPSPRGHRLCRYGNPVCQ